MSVHKATPHPRVKGDPQVCEYCLKPIRIVPGGLGPTWVHEDGYVVGKPMTDAEKARTLITNILRDADKLVPELVKLMADDQLVPGDDADDERLRPFLEELGPWVQDVLDLRNLSNQQKHEARREAE